ncbi:periodic tryptophan protein 2 [Pseudovirgaria hyperparasitica]|uniref:Periodic tryptophan protein 2 n=1 Tax=Pseudovirgaria hyperparasitica TaxID=470096 RepID=A0A6A6VUT2_9PEZI|nr:periodic tryptophan protein 2 [Pseudovirgaria hyperparasitica]KAF2753915.1 periodic tryptophan protein 2 [Pseudovirgaria hyperparasitica]
MKTDFQFSNLLGTVYTRGNLLFSPDGTSLLSPVGNRVTVFDLVNSKSHTLPFAHRKNISRLALHPSGNLLLTVDTDGKVILTHVLRRIVLYHFSFRSAATALSFSPCGRYFAVAIGRRIELWHTPTTPDAGDDGALEFAPFIRHHVHTQHFDDVRSIEWSSDSRFFLSASKDLTARVWSVDAIEGFVPTTLAGHKQGVIGAWFSETQETIYTISKDGALFRWEWTERPSRKNELETTENWNIVERHYFQQNHVDVKCATYHAKSNLLVVGFSNGLFTIHELPDFTQIQNMSLSQSGIDKVTINKSGEWLAFGASRLGQLLVWEWQSESYILKQQGHHDSMNCIVYSPDGQRVVTAADDGKIKVWDVKSGFCIVTFTEHTSGVTACEFAKRGNVLFTASLDGSIRAWDLIRYRNFRTFTAPTRLSFSSLAIDPSGEVVCAGSIDSFDIHIWSVQTGQLLDQLAGHEGPVSSLSFAADGGSLVSGSWDRTVRIWNVFGRTQTSEPCQLQSDVLCVAFRPDSKQVAVSSLDGQVSFWAVSDAVQVGGVDARRDVSGGRRISDRRTAASAAGTKSFHTITYSADGSCVLAGGNSKYMCLYDVQSGALVKKFTVSINLSIDGTQEFLNSRNLTEAGPRGLITDSGDISDEEGHMDRTLPGATRGEASSRRQRPEVKVTSVAFSPTGRSFCAASTEGLLIYSLDTTAQFLPFDLDVSITPDSTRKTLQDRDYLKALIMAFKLDERTLIRYVYERIPRSDIALVVKETPGEYIAPLLRFIAQQADESSHLEFNLLWIEAIVSSHGRHLKDLSGQFTAELRSVQKAVVRIQNELKRLAEENSYAIDYILAQPTKKDALVRRELDLGSDDDAMDSVEFDGDSNTSGDWEGFDT